MKLPWDFSLDKVTLKLSVSCKELLYSPQTHGPMPVLCDLRHRLIISWVKTQMQSMLTCLLGKHMLMHRM